LRCGLAWGSEDAGSGFPDRILLDYWLLELAIRPQLSGQP
jgi:hypothetical protein